MIYDAIIRQMPLSALIDLKGTAEDIHPRLQRLGLEPPAPGKAMRIGAVEVFHPGRAHWLLHAPLEQEEKLLSAVLEGGTAEDTLVLAVSDGYAFFEISGREADQILAIASPLDTGPGSFAVDGATATEAFGLKVILVRRAAGFEMAVERSYAPMLADYFSRIHGV